MKNAEKKILNKGLSDLEDYIKSVMPLNLSISEKKTVLEIVKEKILDIKKDISKIKEI